MYYKAVIFDLFGTLVDNWGGGYVAALADDGVLQELVGSRRDEFDGLWRSDQVCLMRANGELASASDAIRHVCRQMGISPAPEGLRRAQRIRMVCVEAALAPRPGAVEALGQLKRMGLRTALMTVCTGEETYLWAYTPLAPLFDEAVFSCHAGMTKPDPRLYQLACKRLGVEADRCLYVGDGDGQELTGARAVGMDAVLMCAPHEEKLVMRREEARQWAGPRISKLTEVVGLLDREEQVQA